MFILYYVNIKFNYIVRGGEGGYLYILRNLFEFVKKVWEVKCKDVLVYI